MLIQLVLGVMNLAVMVTVGVVIALEKLISGGELVARSTGVVSILGGITLRCQFDHGLADSSLSAFEDPIDQ